MRKDTEYKLPTMQGRANVIKVAGRRQLKLAISQNAGAKEKDRALVS
jgi:hypothetical protein